MSIKYVVTVDYEDGKGVEEVYKGKDYFAANRKFYEFAEEPYWAGEVIKVSLTAIGKGPKKDK